MYQLQCEECKKLVIVKFGKTLKCKNCGHVTEKAIFDIEKSIGE